jgi:hypothetical protein
LALGRSTETTRAARCHALNPGCVLAPGNPAQLSKQSSPHNRAGPVRRTGVFPQWGKVLQPIQEDHQRLIATVLNGEPQRSGYMKSAAVRVEEKPQYESYEEAIGRVPGCPCRLQVAETRQTARIQTFSPGFLVTIQLCASAEDGLDDRRRQCPCTQEQD